MWDQEAELLYLRARYYEPETGRFLSRDTYEGTLRNPLSRNLYAYVGNNPINYVDPTGQVKLYINGKLVQGVTVRDGISYMDATILASKFGLQTRHERDRFGPTNLWTIMNRNWSEFSHYTSSDGKIPIRDFAEDWGIAISYNEVQNAIYLGTQPRWTGKTEELSEELKLMIATVYGEAANCSDAGKEAVANIIMNRVGKREWKKYDTVTKVIKNTGFDAYTHPNNPYNQAVAYLKNRDGSNAEIENTIRIVTAVYNNDREDNTNGAVLVL